MMFKYWLAHLVYILWTILLFIFEVIFYLKLGNIFFQIHKIIIFKVNINYSLNLKRFYDYSRLITIFIWYTDVSKISLVYNLQRILWTVFLLWTSKYVFFKHWSKLVYFKFLNIMHFSAVLVLYLTSILQYDQDESTIIYHMIVFLAYFAPLFGAIISDSYLGKFKYVHFKMKSIYFLFIFHFIFSWFFCFIV